MPLLGACLDLRHYCLEAEGAQPHLAGGCWLPCVSQVVLESHDPLRHRITHGENQSYLSALWNGQRSVKPRSRQFFEQKRGACLSWLMGKGGSRDGSRDSSRASVLPALCPLTRQGRAGIQVPDAEGHTLCPMALGTQTNKGQQKEDCFETSGQTCRSLETLLSQRQSRGAAGRWLSTVS